MKEYATGYTAVRRLLFALPALLTFTGCYAFRAAVIQAPTQQEIDISKKLADNTPGDVTHDIDVDSKAMDGKPLLSILTAQERRDVENKDLTRKYAYASADDFCHNIVLFGQDAYRDSLLMGIPFTLIGIAGTAAATTWAATSDDKTSAPGKVALAATEVDPVVRTTDGVSEERDLDLRSRRLYVMHVSLDVKRSGCVVST